MNRTTDAMPRLAMTDTCPSLVRDTPRHTTSTTWACDGVRDTVLHMDADVSGETTEGR